MIKYPIKLIIKANEKDIENLQKTLSQLEELIKNNAQMSLDPTIEIVLNDSQTSTVI